MPKQVRFEIDSLTEWNSRNTELRPAVVDDVRFANLFRRYLPPGPLDCIEIGAVPGTYLVWLHRELAYRVTGIDFSNAGSVFHETMKVNGITDYQYINADFLTWEPEQRYDVVCSFGFVEHFDDVAPVIRKHCDLVKPGGYLALEVPNYRWLQYAYHWLFDREDLAIHNMGVMKPGVLRRLVEDNGLNTIHSGYHLRTKVWRADRPLGRVARPLEATARRLANVARRLPDTRFTSAVLFEIFRRPPSAESGRRAGR